MYVGGECVNMSVVIVVRGHDKIILSANMHKNKTVNISVLQFDFAGHYVKRAVVDQCKMWNFMELLDGIKLQNPLAFYGRRLCEISDDIRHKQETNGQFVFFL